MIKSLLFKRILKFGIAILLLCVIFTFICNLYIVKITKEYLYNDVTKIPYNKVGLVLGTSSVLINGNANPYYYLRIQRTLELYKAGKISRIIISGDNSRVEYNEPESMQKDLINGGVPSSVIYLDYAGFDTYDSMVRAEAIFSQKRFTVISQEFHNIRAVYIARKKGLNVIAMNCEELNSKKGKFFMKIRESLARVKAFFDVLIDSDPYFYGPKVKIG